MATACGAAIVTVDTRQCATVVAVRMWRLAHHAQLPVGTLIAHCTMDGVHTARDVFTAPALVERSAVHTEPCEQVRWELLNVVLAQELG